MSNLKKFGTAEPMTPSIIVESRINTKYGDTPNAKEAIADYDALVKKYGAHLKISESSRRDDLDNSDEETFIYIV